MASLNCVSLGVFVHCVHMFEPWSSKPPNRTTAALIRTIELRMKLYICDDGRLSQVKAWLVIEDCTCLSVMMPKLILLLLCCFCMYLQKIYMYANWKNLRSWSLKMVTEIFFWPGSMEGKCSTCLEFRVLSFVISHISLIFFGLVLVES